MNGMDMLVNAALKATGFSKEQMTEGVDKGKAMIADFEARLSNVEKNIGEILALLKKERNDNATDVRSGSVDDGV